MLKKSAESIVDGEKDKHIWIVENIKPEWALDLRVPTAALSYFGHMV